MVRSSSLPVGYLPPCLPWLAVCGAWLCFGSFAVPMKSRTVVAAQVHPLVFQCYKTFWNFVCCLLVLLIVPFEFTPWGLVSGFSWVPAGVAAVVAVQNVGIGWGQAIWHATIIFTSLMWSYFILHERVQSWGGTVLGLTTLACGVAGMALAFSRGQESMAGKGKLLEKDGKQVFSEERGFAVNAPPTKTGAASSADAAAGGAAGSPLPPVSYPLGVGAALFNGVWGGSNLVPSHFSSLQGVHYVISFGIGAVCANVALLLLFFLWRRTQGLPMPSPEFRVMLVPGFISGVLWSAGNFCSMYVVARLGQGVGYSLVQASVIVSGLWGIVYFQEIWGRPIFYWLCACLVCGLGIAGLAHEEIA